MNIFKALFGGKEEQPEERKRNEDARNFDVLKYGGVRALRSNQAAYAVQCLTRALEIKDDLESRDYLSQAYLRTDDAPKAYEQLLILSKAQPENQQIYIRMAHVAYIMEDYVAMASACEKALLLENNAPEILYLYAKACIGQGETVKAVEYLTEAIQLKKDFGDAYLLRGEVLLADNALERADADVSFLMEKATENEDVLLLKARVERAKGNLQEAIAYYNKVSEVNPFRIEAYREAGEAKLATGDEAGAKECKSMVDELASQQTADDEHAATERVKNAYRNADVYGAFSNIISNS